jgi:hypothetical protein
MAVALLGLISTRAVSANLEETVDVIVGLKLGQSVEDLRKRFPDLEALDISSKDKPREPFIASWDHPLFQVVGLGVRNSKLRTLSTFNTSFDGGWEAADAVVKYGPALLEEISERWGPAQLLLRQDREQKIIAATWRHEEEILLILMTPPDLILAQAGKNANPSGVFSVSRFVEDQEPDLKKQMELLKGEGRSITIDELEVNYDEYRARMDVRPKKQSAQYFPSELSSVYIGMPTSELREVRPGIHSGDFFDDRYAFFDSVKENQIRYRARMDRLVAAVLSGSDQPGSNKDIFEAWQRWLVRSWGAPNYIQWRLYTTTIEGPSTKELIFVWKHHHCDSAVAVTQWSERVTRIAIFEQGLDPGLNFAGYGKPQTLGTTHDESVVLSFWNAFLDDGETFIWLDDDPAASIPEE